MNLVQLTFMLWLVQDTVQEFEWSFKSHHIKCEIKYQFAKSYFALESFLKR